MRRALKVLGYGLGGIVLLVLVVLGVTFGVTEARTGETWDASAVSIEANRSEQAIARGRHLADHVTLCSRCHGEDLGGHVFLDQPGFATINAPNITRAGVTASYRPEDWVRTIRDCVAPDGSGLVFMPCHDYPELSDADIAALAAYAESVPAVEREMPPPTIGMFGRILWILDMLEPMPARALAHDGRSVPPVDPADRIAHGRYLARAAGCHHCHGEHLSGGPMPGAPDDVAVPRNLTFDGSGLHEWSEESFARALREGVSYPGDRPLDPMMPSEFYSGMTDDEVHALYAFLESLPHRSFGGR